MKKNYSKPEILFEDFTLTANIATGCEEIVNSAENICAWKFSFGGIDINVFNKGVVQDCDTEPAGINDTLCYHVPDGYNTFTS